MKLVRTEKKRDFVGDLTNLGKELFFEYTNSNSSLGKMISYVTGKKNEENKEEGNFIKRAFERFFNTFKPYVIDYRPESKTWADSAFQNSLKIQLENKEFYGLSIIPDAEKEQIVFTYYVLSAELYEHHWNIANDKGEIFNPLLIAIGFGKKHEISLKEFIETAFDTVEKSNNLDDLQKAIFGLLTQFKKQDSDFEEVKNTFVIDNALQMPQIEAKRLNP